VTDFLQQIGIEDSATVVFENKAVDGSMLDSFTQDD